MNEKKVLITGATAMLGGCALRIRLENPDVSLVMNSSWPQQGKQSDE
jgi:hypothetical protein